MSFGLVSFDVKRPSQWERMFPFQWQMLTGLIVMRDDLMRWIEISAPHC